MIGSPARRSAPMARARSSAALASATRCATTTCCAVSFWSNASRFAAAARGRLARRGGRRRWSRGARVLCELAQRGAVALRRDVTELLTPVLGCGLTHVEARHHAVDRARHVERDGTRLHQRLECVALGRELRSLLLDRGDLRFVLGDLGDDGVVLLLRRFELGVGGVCGGLCGLEVGLGLDHAGIRLDQTLLGPRREREPQQDHRERRCRQQPPSGRTRPVASTPHQADSVRNSCNTGNTANGRPRIKPGRGPGAGNGSGCGTRRGRRPRRTEPPRSRCLPPRTVPRSGP